VNVFNTAGSTDIDTGDNVNLALKNPTTGITINNANLSNDGDTLTGSDGGIFQVDLGASYDIRRIHFKENAGFNSFMVLISTSDDGAKWTPQQWVYCKGDWNAGRMYDNLIFGNYKARYLQIKQDGIDFGGRYGFPTFYEVEVYKTGMVTNTTGVQLEKINLKHYGKILNS